MAHLLRLLLQLSNIALGSISKDEKEHDCMCRVHICTGRAIGGLINSIPQKNPNRTRSESNNLHQPTAVILCLTFLCYLIVKELIIEMSIIIERDYSWLV
jgi:hypothetical protein